MRIQTKQYGELSLSFRHHTGDTRVELNRALMEHHKGDFAAAEKDFKELERLSSIPRIRLFVDVGDKYTVASIRPARENTEGPLPYDNIYFGYTYLMPGDNYTKEEGRERSLKRAIDQLPGITDATRREILSGYYQR